MADDVLPADEVAALQREWGQVHGLAALFDSHESLRATLDYERLLNDERKALHLSETAIVERENESLRATVARLRTAARGVAAVSDNHAVHTGNCWACESASGHADWCPIATLRAALDATAGPAPEPTPTPLASREDIRTVLAGVIEDDCTTTAFLAAEDRLVALLDADPREVIFRGHVADWENPSPDSGDWPKAVLDGQWLTDPAQTPGTEVQVFATGPDQP